MKRFADVTWANGSDSTDNYAMAMTPRLDLRQSQSLVMTPQLQQAIKLLQLSNLELTAYVETQLEQNPFLERVEGDPENKTGDNAGEDPAPTATNADPVSADTAMGETNMDYSDTQMDLDYHENLYDGEPQTAGTGSLATSVNDPGYGRRGGSFEDDLDGADSLVADKPSLREHLERQLLLEMGDPIDRVIGLHLIDSLDAAGYVTGDLAEIGAQLGCSSERVEITLAQIQGFDPPGVFSRSLQECLELQLMERGRLNKPMQKLVDNLERLADHDMVFLMSTCGVSKETLASMIQEIRNLDPKPALAYDPAIAQPVIPDVLMRPQRDGGWIVELNTDALPHVLVNDVYYARVSRSNPGKDDRQYITECMNTANWLVKSLQQRATTILKVSTEIVRQQHDFFIRGVEGLRPLILRNVADAISMHESTVSRVTSNKFIASPRGIYELKYFFSHAIGGARGGDVHSAEWVRHRIKALIDAENPSQILSDDALAEMLQKEGIDIARRTVAKYREALGLPSSVRRRRQKMGAANLRRSNVA
jgi:RNA polymerase sigma-54 factor